MRTGVTISPDIFKAIREKVRELEDLAGMALLEPEKAAGCCREIRTGCFALNRLTGKAFFTSLPDKPPSGTSAA
ncbi:MAG: hypothetical protein LBI86_00230 [Treponema sp.]|jgi:hypothetical protein|nr:hypothetical protein [Treponema sp.]